MALPQNRSNAIAMPLDYLNEASDEVQRLFTRLDGVERIQRKEWVYRNDPRDWMENGKYTMRRIDMDRIEAGYVVRALVKW